MSSALSTFATVGGVAGAVGSLLGGGTTVTLGGVSFTNFAVPGTMKLAIRQRISRQVPPGSAVVANFIGPDWPPIEWRGIFNTLSAASTVRQLYTMTKAGQPVQLSWLDQVFTVGIESFQAEAITASYYRYRIRCVVISDTSQSNGQDATPSLSQQLLSSINSAVGFNVVDAAGQAATVLGKVQQAAGLVGALVPGSAAFASLGNIAGIASGVVGGAIPLAESAINGIGSVVSGATSAVTWLNSAVTSTGNLANATAASSYAGATVQMIGHA